VIADEVSLREAHGPKRLPRLFRWQRSGYGAVEASATLAETYRALRRGRELAKDSPGAGDFYYGEMEMRRRCAPRVDRVLLFAYWLVSGYGLRASRAFAGYVVAVAAIAAAIHRWGLTSHAGLGRVLAYVLLSSATILQKPSPGLPLNTAGTYFEFAARVSGPALLALMVLALRSRVRRSA
jgi:hypothetical protein